MSDHAKPIYNLYGHPVPHPSTLNIDSILDRFPRPGIGRGHRPASNPRGQQARGFSFVDHVDDWEPSRQASVRQNDTTTSARQGRASERSHHRNRGPFHNGDDENDVIGANSSPSYFAALQRNGLTAQQGRSSSRTKDNVTQAQGFQNAADRITMDPGEDERDDDSDDEESKKEA